MFVQICVELEALVAVVGKAFDADACTLLEREGCSALHMLTIGFDVLAICVLQSLSICCVVHAFIYAEPKQINKNQSGFGYESDRKRSYLELIDTKVSLLVQQNGVGDECI